MDPLIDQSRSRFFRGYQSSFDLEMERVFTYFKSSTPKKEMTRKSGFKWQDQIAMYIHSENELFVYVGTAKNPRSSAIKLTNNSIAEPVKLPPISKNSLDQRHPNEGDLQLKNTQLTIKIKFLYAFFQRNEKLFFESIRDHDQTNLIYKNAKEVKSKTPDQLLDGIYFHQDFDKWFNKKKRPTPIFNAFINITSRPNRNTRQVALTQIVSEMSARKELPKAMILLLLGLRPELTISIFREFGRQQKYFYPFPEIAEHYFKETDNSELRKYVFYYLLNQNYDFIIQSPNYKDLMTKQIIFSSLSPQERTNQIISGLTIKSANTKNCLMGTYELNIVELSRLTLSLYQNFKVAKKHRVNIRAASLQLLKLIEISPKPELCGFIIALNSMGRRVYVFEDEKKVSGVRIHTGPTNYTSKYVIRRTNKLLELWNNIGLDDFVNRALMFYITHVPPEHIEIEKRRITINRRLTATWQKSQPTIQKFGNKITSFLGDDKNQLNEAIITQAQLNNRFTLEWLDTSFRSKTLISAMETGTGENILSLFIINLPKKLTKIISKIIEERKGMEISNWSKSDLNNEQLEKIISFFMSTQTFMPLNLFTHIVDLIFKQKYDQIETFTNYITSINHNQRPQISHQYLQIVFVHIEKFVHKHIEDPLIINFCTNFVIDWEKITFRKVREEDEYKFEALRIVYEKELKTNKPNTWDELSVETISYVYTLSNLQVPSLIDGSLQYAMNKPNWEQLARHYLAMGIVRPLTSEIKKTRLKDVPKYLLRDVEGLIALITETILYCERNGFNRAFEDLLIQHMYRRGWNIDRNMARKLPGLMGNISPRLRSYFAAYLLFEQGEVSLDVLKFARDIGNYQLRERVLRTLDRYATPEMLIVLAESKFNDISDASIEKLSNTRNTLPDKKRLFTSLLRSTNPKVREIGIKWFKEGDIEPEMVLTEIVLEYMEMYDFYFQALERITRLNYKKAVLIFQFFKFILWQPRMKNIWIEKINRIIESLIKQGLMTELILNEYQEILGTQIQNRVNVILPTYIEVMEL